MLREDLGLVLHQLGRMGLERCSDPGVQLLTSTTQQAAMRCVLHQRVLEAVDRVGRCATLEHQLGLDQPSNGAPQLVVGKAGDGT